MSSFALWCAQLLSTKHFIRGSNLISNHSLINKWIEQIQFIIPNSQIQKKKNYLEPFYLFINKNGVFWLWNDISCLCFSDKWFRTHFIGKVSSKRLSRVWQYILTYYILLIHITFISLGILTRYTQRVRMELNIYLDTRFFKLGDFLLEKVHVFSFSSYPEWSKV